MASQSTWAWTLTIQIAGLYGTDLITGSTLAPAGSTADTILPGIVSDIQRDHPSSRFSVVSFTASQTS